MNESVNPVIQGDEVTREIAELFFGWGLIVPAGPPEMMFLSH